jgi:hypothetical protein
VSEPQRVSKHGETYFPVTGSGGLGEKLPGADPGRPVGGGRGLWECLTCGAVVVSMPRHDSWHLKGPRSE